MDLNFEITGRHVTITDALRAHCREKLDHDLRHAPSLHSAHVILASERNRHSAEILVHGPRLHATVHAEADDLYLAFDRCAEKLRAQLERERDRRLDRRRRGGRAPAVEAVPPGSPGPDGDETDAAPPPLKRSRLKRLKPMTVHEALIELESTRDGLVVFRDADSEELAVLHRRPGGRVVLIETGAK